MAALAIEDVVLIDRCIGGEEAAARELFRRHQRRVHGTLYRILGSNRDMDDLIQETFIQVFRSLPGFRGDARLSTWIDRITVRVAYRHIGRRSRTPIPIDDGFLAEVPANRANATDQLNAREGVRQLYAVLATLSPKLRIAFALSAIDGRPMAEVAALLETTETTAKVRVWRARRAIEKAAAHDSVLGQFIASMTGDTP